jgi:hypothetical protein
MAEIKRCKEPFATEIDGMLRVIAAGALVSTDDPAYTKGTADHFEDVGVHLATEKDTRARAAGKVEQATAAPGEKRSTTPDESAMLRDELEEAGVKVDKRWGLDRLHEEKAKLQQAKD